MKDIYLDYAAATPLDPEVKKAMESYEAERFGNPSSIHRKGEEAKKAVDKARAAIAEILGCKKDELIFTSGATEADNLAIRGIAKKYPETRILTTPMEHRAILHVCEKLEEEGRRADYIPVDECGRVDPDKIMAMIRPDTALVSVEYANSEIGTIQRISDIGEKIRDMRKKRADENNALPLYFHTDASQAAEFLDLAVEKLGIDLMTLSAGKIYGPKGTGLLYVRRGVLLEPMLYGGGQEKGIRSGTENVPGIVGFAKALEIAQKSKNAESRRMSELRDWFIEAIRKEIQDAVLNGHPDKRLPNNVNISIPGMEGEALVLYLDAKGVYASTGSACTAAALAPSHVLRALGKRDKDIQGSLRFTLGRSTTKKDLDYALNVLRSAVEKLRS